MNRITKRVTAVLCALTAAAAPLSAVPSVTVSAETRTIEQINKEKKEKQEQINKKKEQLSALADDLSKKAQYEQTLNEQIGLITDKLTLIDAQLQDLHVNMEDTEEKIASLEEQIAAQKEQVAKDMELFKKRIRALYVHGNDGILSALVGANSFYDVLSRIDIVKRISKHDNEVIERLRDEIRELNKSEQDLTANLQALDLQETEMNVLCDEFKASQDELHIASEKNESEMQQIRGQQAVVKGQIDSYQEMIEELDTEEDKLIAEAIAKAEAERKAKEEAERKAKEEAERKAKEEAERKAKEEAERKAKVEAERKAKEETERKAKEEADRLAKEKASAQTQQPAAVTQAPVTQQQSTVTSTTAKPAAPVTTAAPQQNNGSKLQWPAPGHYHVSSTFGWRTLHNQQNFHSGIDISDAGINGAAACAAASGTVFRVRTGCTHNKGKNYNCGCNSGYGNYVMISHGNGMYTLYAHLANPTVSEGQAVTVGQQIGVIGSTGHSTGPHLHFEVYIGGSSSSNRVNPLDYLP